MKRLLVTTSLLCAFGCGPKEGEATASPADGAGATATPAADQGTAAAEVDVTARVEEILAGTHRSEDNRARDGARHPAETLAFFGVQPTDTVVELWPGGGWYTEILAPLVKDAGTLRVTIYDPAGPEAYYGTGQAKKMLERFAAEADIFGGTEHVIVPQDVAFDDKGKVSDITVKPFSLGAPGSADVVLTFRNSHGWYNRGAQEMVYAAVFEVLRPGGVFGVVQHRAAEGADPAETGKLGYLPEATVIEAAQAAGFELAERSEINANPKDTRDYADGVWTLPPSLTRGDADRDKYLAIGESDRMTLKFVKPGG
jgi:predicted methyltransferase